MPKIQFKIVDEVMAWLEKNGTPKYRILREQGTFSEDSETQKALDRGVNRFHDFPISEAEVEARDLSRRQTRAAERNATATIISCVAAAVALVVSVISLAIAIKGSG